MGILAGVVAMMAVGFIGGQFFTFDGPADPSQREAMLTAVGSAPVGTQLTLLLSWFVAAFAGAAVAKWISGASWPGWLIAGLLALILALTFLVPFPVWMQSLAVVGPLVGGALADLLVRRRPPEERAGLANDAEL